MRRSIQFFKDVSLFAQSSRRGFVVTAEVVVGLLASLSSLFLFVKLANEMLEKEFTFFDVGISQFVYTLRTPSLTSLMIFITTFGGVIPIFIATLITVIFLIKKHHKEAVLFCLALIMGTILNNSLKIMMHRTRPGIAPLVIERSYSFPSGHAMNSLIFYGILAYFSYHFFRNKKLSILSGIIAIIMIILIGFSRVYLGVHYPSDVIAGYTAGFFWLVTLLFVDRTFIFLKIFRKNE
jgi:membrane-associated phospholipid phosphatase